MGWGAVYRTPTIHHIIRPIKQPSRPPPTQPAQPSFEPASLFLLDLRFSYIWIICTKICLCRTVRWHSTMICHLHIYLHWVYTFFRTSTLRGIASQAFQRITVMSCISAIRAHSEHLRHVLTPASLPSFLAIIFVHRNHMYEIPWCINVAPTFSKYEAWYIFYIRGVSKYAIVFPSFQWLLTVVFFEVGICPFHGMEWPKKCRYAVNRLNW